MLRSAGSGGSISVVPVRLCWNGLGTMTNSSLKELFARAERVPGDTRVSSGSPAVCVLRRLRRSPETISIARALMRRRVPVKEAYDTVSRLLTEQRVVVRVPMLEDG